MAFLNIFENEIKSHYIFYIIIFVAIAMFLFTVYDKNLIEPSSDFSSENYLGTLDFLNSLEIETTKSFAIFTQNETFQRIGVLLTFLYGMTPSVIPVPNEIFMSAVILAQDTVEEQIDEAIYLIIITSIAGFIGDSLVFLVSKYHLHKLFGHEQKPELEESHVFHRYGVVVFLITPSLWFAGGLADLALIYAGYVQVSFRKLAPFLLAGNIIRGIWGGIILLGVLNLLSKIPFPSF